MHFSKPLLLLLLIGFLFLSSPASAQLIYENFEYEVSGNNVTITRYFGPGGDVVIPGTIAGMPVTTIGGGCVPIHIGQCTGYVGAFEGCYSLTSVIIPDSVTTIWGSAFAGCFNLATLTLPASIRSVEEYAFAGCSGLTTLNIMDGITRIGPRAFIGCSGLTIVPIPASVTNIQEQAFYGCTNLTGAYFCGNAPLMESYVFDNCSSDFTVYHTPLGTGFTNPWYGYSTAVFETPCTTVSTTTTSVILTTTTSTETTTTTTATADVPCVVEIFPGFLSKAVNSLSRFYGFIIRGDENAAFSRTSQIGWGTSSVQTLLQVAFAKRFIIALVVVDATRLKVGDVYEVTVDNCTGELPVRMF